MNARKLPIATTLLSALAAAVIASTACSSEDDAATPSPLPDAAPETSSSDVSATPDTTSAADTEVQPDTSCTPVPNLVAWWRGEQNPEDSKGPHEGVWISETNDAGKPKYTTGHVGSAFDFASTLSRIQVSDHADLDFVNAFTIDAWINLSGPKATGPIFQKMTAGQTDGYMFEVFQGDLRFTVGGARVSSRDDVAVPSETFVHVAATFNAPGALRLFVNGVEATGTPMGLLDAGAPTNAFAARIGADDTVSANHFPGVIDEIGVYSSALSVQDIASIVARGSSGRCP